MKKTQQILLFFLFLLFLPVCRAGVLDDFEVELARVAQTGNYKNAVNAPNSRFAREYERSLRHLTTLGRQLDREVNSALSGGGYSFQNLAGELVKIYQFNAEKMRHPENFRKKQNNRNRRANNRKKDLQRIMQDPVPLFKFLLADIKALRKLGFTGEGHTPLSGKSILARDLLIFRTNLSTFTSFRGQYFRKKTPEAFRKEFDNRLTALSFSARKLQDSLQKYGGKNASLECNIAQETTFIVNNFAKYRELVLKGRRGSGKNTASSYLGEIRFSIRKIEGALSALSRAGLETSSASIRPLARSSKRRVAASYRNLGIAALEKELLRRRELIYRKNALMDGVDKDTLRKYLLSLTREERRIYETVRKERTENGYSTASATRTAILAIHSQMRIKADKQTLITLLERLDKEEEKEERGKF